MAQTERLEKFKKLYYEDPSRFYLKDNNKNWIPIQFAVFKSKIKIIELILKLSDDKSN